jgi:Site-specific recombinases, DNA invertase Pin homologs
MKVGYCRVSTSGQSLEIQLEKLQAVGCDKIFSEKQSGKTASDRQELQNMLEFVREGDSVVITRLDRISRSMADLLDIATKLETKGVTLTATEQVFDTSSSSGKLMFNLLGAFAAFELDIRKERQMEGITKALAEQRPYGRPVTTDHDQIKEELKAGKSVAEVVREQQVSRTAVYNIRKTMIQNGEI